MRRVLCLGVFTLLFAGGCAARPEQTMDERLEFLNSVASGAGLQEQVIGEVPAATYEATREQWEIARSGYADALRKLPSRAEIEERLHTVEMRLQLLDREHAYSSQIEIRNLEQDRSRGRYSGLPAEGIFGEVKNLGDKSVVKLV